MVDIESNNGDAISCVVLLLDNIAHENNAMVMVTTHHEDDCALHRHMDDSALTNDVLEEMEPTSKEAMQHLYSCNCDPNIEAVFSTQTGEALLVPISLSNVRKTFPWMKDKKATKKMLETAMELGPESPLIKEAQPFFNKQHGHPIQISVGSMFGKPGIKSVH